MLFKINKSTQFFQISIQTIGKIMSTANAKLFIFINLIIFSLGDFRMNIKNCLYKIINNHLSTEQNLIFSSSEESDLDFLNSNFSINTENGELFLNNISIDTEHDESFLKNMFNSSNWCFQLYTNTNKDIASNVPGQNEAYIVWSGKNNPEDIAEDLKQQFTVLRKCEAWNPRAKFVILIHNKLGEDIDQKSLAETIFSKLWKYFIFNVIVLMHSSDSSDTYEKVNIYTWFPYHPPGRCANVYEPVLLDIYITQETTFLNNTMLFPNKLTKNLHGCKLRISTFELGPMTFKQVTNDDGSIEFLEGFEVELYKMMGKGLNMSIFYMQRSDNVLFGVQLENGSWTGITGEIIRNYSDIASSWYKCHIIKQFDCLTPHVIDRAKWFVPCAQPYPRWSSLTRVFKPSLWLGLLSAYVVVAYAMHLVVFLRASLTTPETRNYGYYGKSKVFLNFWAIILSGSAPGDPPHNFSLRSVFLAWVLYCWAVNNVYQTFLTSFLIDPGLQHQISTEEELLTSGTLKYGYDVETEAVIPGLLEERYKNHQICESYEDCQQRLLGTQNFAFVFGKVITDYDIAAHHMTADGKPLICQVEDVVMNQITSMTVLKGHPLLRFFNMIIRSALEAGLVEKWFEDVKYTATLRAASNFNMPPGEYITLSLQHLQSAFYFLFFGLFLSLMAFIGELINYNR